MRRIQNFPVALTDQRRVVEMPEGAEILSVGDQAGAGATLNVWAIVDDEKPNVPRRLAIALTGHPLDPEVPADAYIATVATAGGSLIWHVFELPEPAKGKKS